MDKERTSVAGILRDNGFRFNKQFGQNFITDSNLLDAIVADSGITDKDVVLEIGAGAGTLTAAIAKKAKRVTSFEIDTNLIPVLSETLKGLDDKVEVVFNDIMKVTDEELRELVGDRYKLVANLPYYITTPIIMRFLEGFCPPESISIMVQKEVADRLTARENTADYGAITVAVSLAGSAKITRIVRKELFYPMPKVDSAIVRIDLDKEKPHNIAEIKRIVKGAFAMRRKTLINNLSAIGFKKEECESALLSMGLDTRIRGEVLSPAQYVELTDKLTGR